MLAANVGSVSGVQILIEAGADVSLTAKDGWTALEAAEMIGDDESATLLRQAGATR